MARSDPAADPRWNPREMMYLWQLASELGTMPVLQWLQARNAWADILRLAFCYLDVDGDGLLSPTDLACHIIRQSSNGQSGQEVNHQAWVMACRWVSRWQDQTVPVPLTAQGCSGLPLDCFRDALLASHGNDVAFLGGSDVPVP